MSIIQEALKKIGSPDKKAADEHKKPAIPVEGVKKHEPAVETPGPKYVYYVITALLVIILAGIVMKVSGSPSAPSPSAPASVIKKMEPILPKIERREETVQPRRRKSDIGGFVLNGIMYLVDGPRAIINDIIVGEGETVNGAKVEKIGKDNVLLKYKDSEVDLNINR